jgi:hypothetical protein
MISYPNSQHLALWTAALRLLKPHYYLYKQGQGNSWDIPPLPQPLNNDAVEQGYKHSASFATEGTNSKIYVFSRALPRE